MKPWIQIKRPWLGVWYTSFIPIPSLTSPPSCYPSSSSPTTSFFQPVFPYLLSLPLTLVTLCIFVSLYRSIIALFSSSCPCSCYLSLSYFWAHILQSCLHVVNWLSWLHSSLAPLHFSPLYLPTRLIITSGAVELMAQFRKGKKKKKKEGTMFSFC